MPAHIRLLCVFRLLILLALRIFIPLLLALRPSLRQLLQVLQLLILFNHGPVLLRIVPIPPISLRIPPQVYFLYDFISLYILPSPPRALLPWSTQAFLRLVCHCSTVLAGTLSELGGSWTLPLSSVVPFRLIGSRFLETLMFEVVLSGGIIVDVEGFL